MADVRNEPEISNRDDRQAHPHPHDTEQSDRGRSNERGFASMSPAKQREIASKGGRAAHEKGTAHEFTSEEARAAGRKGGEKVSQNREHMSQIGSRGGRASHDRDSENETLQGQNDQETR